MLRKNIRLRVPNNYLHRVTLEKEISYSFVVKKYCVSFLPGAAAQIDKMSIKGARMR